jgi:hypothetical protein
MTGEHYEGVHWLGSFAVYLVTKRGIPAKPNSGLCSSGSCPKIVIYNRVSGWRALVSVLPFMFRPPIKRIHDGLMPKPFVPVVSSIDCLLSVGLEHRSQITV